MVMSVAWALEYTSRNDTCTGTIWAQMHAKSFRHTDGTKGHVCHLGAAGTQLVDGSTEASIDGGVRVSSPRVKDTCCQHAQAHSTKSQAAQVRDVTEGGGVGGWLVHRHGGGGVGTGHHQVRRGGIPGVRLAGAREMEWMRSKGRGGWGGREGERTRRRQRGARRG